LTRHTSFAIGSLSSREPKIYRIWNKPHRFACSRHDSHLRSLSEVTGYDIQASDGAIGHLESVLLEDDVWDIRYLIIDTKNWWPGQHVLLSPYAVQDVELSKRQIFLNVSCEQVKASPPWAPLDLIDQAYEKRLHRHYVWPGYGW
jgi:hypothetical protein